MEDICIWTYLKAQQAKAQVKRGVKWFFSSESGGAGIIAAVILIVLVVVLGVAFRKTIASLWGKLWGQVNTEDISEAIAPHDFGGSGGGNPQ